VKNEKGWKKEKKRQKEKGRAPFIVYSNLW